MVCGGDECRMSSSIALRHILIYTRDVMQSVSFWGPRGLGLHVLVASDHLAELVLQNDCATTIALKKAHNDSQMTQGNVAQLVRRLFGFFCLGVLSVVE